VLGEWVKKLDNTRKLCIHRRAFIIEIKKFLVCAGNLFTIKYKHSKAINENNGLNLKR